MAHFIDLPLLGSSLLIASVGSLHCLGMCGGIASINATRTQDTTHYQLGRLLGYATLGTFFGLVGNRLFAIAGAHPSLEIGFILLLVFLFLFQAFQWAIGNPDRGFFGFVPKIKFLQLRFFSGGPLLMGLGTALLPCGWLASFGILAASTGSGLNGALVFTMLWLGSLPALFLVGWGLFHFRSQIRGKAVRLVMAFLVLCSGFYSLNQHWSGKHSMHGERSLTDDQTRQNEYCLPSK